MGRGELPKYRTIANDVRQQIDSGQLAPGEQLPAQTAMAADYGVTVMTLRQALAELEHDGLVRAERGKGTFVANAPAVTFGLNRLSSFAQEMAHQGTSIETEVLCVDNPSAMADAARAYRAAPEFIDEDVVTVVRRRSINGAVVVVQRSLLASGLWQLVEGSDLTSQSLYDALADRARARVERASETFRAVTVTGDNARLLGVGEGTAAMESTRVSFDGDGSPFLVDHALMIGSATEIRAERTTSELRLGYAAQ